MSVEVRELRMESNSLVSSDSELVDVWSTCRDFHLGCTWLNVGLANRLRTNVALTWSFVCNFRQNEFHFQRRRVKSYLNFTWCFGILSLIYRSFVARLSYNSYNYIFRKIIEWRLTCALCTFMSLQIFYKRAKIHLYRENIKYKIKLNISNFSNICNPIPVEDWKKISL